MHLRFLIGSILFLCLIWPSQEQRPGSTSRGGSFGRGGNSSPSSSSNNKPEGSKPNKPRDPDEEIEPESEDVFKCPRADGLFADALSCKKFYLCGAWRPYHQSCPPSLYFDDKLKFCTFKTNQLRCGPIENAEAEEDSEKFNQENLKVCDRKACQLPNCWCSDDGTVIPGILNPNEAPQFILLGFAGAVNELVFESYKKVLGYHGKFNPTQNRLNPNQCGIKGTFFINHEYSNYAEIQWFSAQGHEIALSTITHRQPETWWTESANYSDYAEEVIGLREILLKYANGGSSNGPLTRDNVIGMRVPFIKPGGDVMYEMGHDFGLAYDSSLVAPKLAMPLWPWTWDYRQPFECSNQKQKNAKDANTEASDNAETRDAIVENNNRHHGSRSGQPTNSAVNTRRKRNSPYLGRPLHCPTKPYPGLWEIPVNPLSNEHNTCPTADQCVFPSSDESDDSEDIVSFLQENFEHHYNTNRAPFQLNFHVNWFTAKNKVKALSKFIESILSKYNDVYFVTYQQLVSWLRNPTPVKDYKPACETRNVSAVCNRPHTCVLKHYLNEKGEAATADNAVRTETRYMPVCHQTSCPPAQYPWFNNISGQSKNFKTIMQLVEESSATSSTNHHYAIEMRNLRLSPLGGIVF